MTQLYILEKSIAGAKTILSKLQHLGLSQEDIHVVASKRWQNEILPATESTIEQETDIQQAQVRATAAGATTGALAGLSLAFIPGANFAAASALLAGGLAGGGLGTAIGTLVGSSEKHPIVARFERDVADGKMLIVADLQALETRDVAYELAQSVPGSPMFYRDGNEVVQLRMT